MTALKVGFTGTREGMTDAQFAALAALILGLNPSEWHHGDCVGSDAQSHSLAMARGASVIIHPPVNRRNRAFCWPGVIREPKPYGVRDRDIVNETDMLIATPKSFTEIERGSGTWSTIRYARTLGRRIYIAWPDGSVSTEKGKQDGNSEAHEGFRNPV